MFSSSIISSHACLPFLFIGGFSALRVCIFDPCSVPGGEGGEESGELDQEDGTEGN